MKPVAQTIVGKPNGNCFGACVASILELPVEEVWEAGALDGDEFWLGWKSWLESRGWSFVHILAGAWFLPPRGHAIANGDSDRGLPHSVVMLDGKMVHDPHPSGTGLVDGKVETWVILYPMQ